MRSMKALLKRNEFFNKMGKKAALQYNLLFGAKVLWLVVNE